jgi:hypothetical protein
VAHRRIQAALLLSLKGIPSALAGGCQANAYDAAIVRIVVPLHEAALHEAVYEPRSGAETDPEMAGELTHSDGRVLAPPAIEMSRRRSNAPIRPYGPGDGPKRTYLRNSEFPFAARDGMADESAHYLRQGIRDLVYDVRFTHGRCPDTDDGIERILRNTKCLPNQVSS